jgi:hypothetical protein
MNQANSPKPIRDFVGGLLLAIILHSLFIGLMLMVIGPSIGSAQPWSDIWVFMLFGFGLSQWLYLVPAIVYFQRRGRSEVLKGIFLAAMLAVLLNGTCAAIPIFFGMPLSTGLSQNPILGMMILSLVVMFPIAFYSFKQPKY